MLDPFSRKINYLRISVTDRCNLRCTYCMPEDGVHLMSHKDILSYEEIVDIVAFGATKGINKIRITGGEPLVRKDLPKLIEQLSSIQGIEDIGLTTNGILLEKFAPELKKAGLNRVNVSLDTLNPEKYHKITRLGNIHAVFRGIDAAIEIGLTPVKINCVRMPQNEDEIEDLKKWALDKGIGIRFIHQMNLETGEFSEVDGGTGGICKICNRLRLTADGFIKPCLFSEFAYSTREMGIENAYKAALHNKPECGSLNRINSFYNIGG